MFKPLKPRMRTHYTNLGNPTSMPIFYWTIDIIFLALHVYPGSLPCTALLWIGALRCLHNRTQAPKMNMIEHGMWLSLCVPQEQRK